MSDGFDPTIPVSRREWDRVRPGRVAHVSYRPVRESNSPIQSARGEISMVENTDDGPRIRFYDDYRDREITVTLADRIGETAVESHGERSTTLGHLLRLEVGDSDAAIHNASIDYVVGQGDGDSPIVAAAWVAWNGKRLELFEVPEEVEA